MFEKAMRIGRNRKGGDTYRTCKD